MLCDCPIPVLISHVVHTSPERCWRMALLDGGNWNPDKSSGEADVPKESSRNYVFRDEISTSIALHVQSQPGTGHLSWPPIHSCVLSLNRPSNHSRECAPWDMCQHRLQTVRNLSNGSVSTVPSFSGSAFLLTSSTVPRECGSGMPSHCIQTTQLGM